MHNTIITINILITIILVISAIVGAYIIYKEAIKKEDAPLPIYIIWALLFTAWLIIGGVGLYLTKYKYYDYAIENNWTFYIDEQEVDPEKIKHPVWYYHTYIIRYDDEAETVTLNTRWF